MPICFQVVPDPAPSRRRAKELTSASVSRWVMPSSSLRPAWTKTLIRSSQGSARRAATIGAIIAMTSAGRPIAARRSSACSGEMPKLPVIVRMGTAAHRSVFSSARPRLAKLSMRAWTVCSIQLVIHHRAFAGVNDGCTSAR
jgi:hypothetical protein